MIAPPPEVRPGDPVLPAWRRMVAFSRSLRPFAGSNTLITSLPNGYLVSFPPADFSWAHPFAVNFQSGKIKVSTGLIDQMEPTIGGLPISGISSSGTPLKAGAPLLTLENNYDSERRSWIIARCECLESGDIMSAEILQIKNYPTPSPNVLQADVALAMIKNLSVGGPTIFQIVYHNLSHQWLQPSGAAGRHFFSAA